MNKVGFITSWMQNEEVNNIENIEPVQSMINEAPLLTHAHQELVARIEGAEVFMTSKAFYRLSKIKKAEMLGEYKWLVAINAQLGGQ